MMCLLVNHALQSRTIICFIIYSILAHWCHHKKQLQTTIIQYACIQHETTVIVTNASLQVKPATINTLQKANFINQITQIHTITTSTIAIAVHLIAKCNEADFIY